MAEGEPKKDDEAPKPEQDEDDEGPMCRCCGQCPVDEVGELCFACEQGLFSPDQV